MLQTALSPLNRMNWRYVSQIAWFVKPLEYEMTDYMLLLDWISYNVPDSGTLDDSSKVSEFLPTIFWTLSNEVCRQQDFGRSVSTQGRCSSFTDAFFVRPNNTTLVALHHLAAILQRTSTCQCLNWCMYFNWIGQGKMALVEPAGRWSTTFSGPLHLFLWLEYAREGSHQSHTRQTCTSRIIAWPMRLLYIKISIISFELCQVTHFSIHNRTILTQAKGR